MVEMEGGSGGWRRWHIANVFCFSDVHALQCNEDDTEVLLCVGVIWCMHEKSWGGHGGTGRVLMCN